MKRQPKIRFVLIRPRNPLNIGASARAMANFGISELFVVNPYEPIWRETRSAMGGEDVLKKAKRVDHLLKAIKGCGLVVGTSCAKKRLRDDRWVFPDTLKKDFISVASQGVPVAFLFGQEKTGLTNDELNFCQRILQIPTTPQCPSMNLGQAVAVVGYLVNSFLDSKVTVKQNGMKKTLPVDQLERLVQEGLVACEKAGLYRGWDSAIRKKRLRRALYKWNLQDGDAAMLHGLFRWVKKRGVPSP